MFLKIYVLISKYFYKPGIMASVMGTHVAHSIHISCSLSKLNSFHSVFTNLDQNVYGHYVSVKVKNLGQKPAKSPLQVWIMAPDSAQKWLNRPFQLFNLNSSHLVFSGYFWQAYFVIVHQSCPVLVKCGLIRVNLHSLWILHLCTLCFLLGLWFHHWCLVFYTYILFFCNLHNLQVPYFKILTFSTHVMFCKEIHWAVLW